MRSQIPDHLLFIMQKDIETGNFTSWGVLVGDPFGRSLDSYLRIEEAIRTWNQLWLEYKQENHVQMHRLFNLMSIRGMLVRYAFGTVNPDGTLTIVGGTSGGGGSEKLVVA